MIRLPLDLDTAPVVQVRLVEAEVAFAKAQHCGANTGGRQDWLHSYFVLNYEPELRPQEPYEEVLGMGDPSTMNREDYLSEILAELRRIRERLDSIDQFIAPPVKTSDLRDPARVHEENLYRRK